MKILVLSDLHGDLKLIHEHKKRIIKEKIDLVIVAGDITLMGRNLKPILSRINTFRAKVLLIHGNHEDEKKIKEIINNYDNIIYLHKKIINIKNWWFGAFSTSGLREKYPEQESWVKKNKDLIKKAKKLIWIDHAPPFNTLIDYIDGFNVGSKSLRKFIEEYQPDFVFCGHIHETFGSEDMINNTIIINPGPKGKIIEL